MIGKNVLTQYELHHWFLLFFILNIFLIIKLKKLRSIVSGGGDQYDEFFRNLRQLDLPLVTTVKDLRSQIVREACITLAFMSVRLTHRFERTAEGVLPAMLYLIQNSAKVISTSGAVAMRYVVTNTPSSKLVPLILTGIESKSKEIRRFDDKFSFWKSEIFQFK